LNATENNPHKTDLEEIKLAKYTSPAIKNAIYEKKLQLIKENKKES
jgi:hypothetical protein